MAKEFKHDGETFLLDDSKGCFVEVTYAEHQEYVGVVGVNIRGTASAPYAVNVISTPNGSGRDRVIKGDQVDGNSARDMGDALDKCCKSLVDARLQDEDRNQFDPEATCHNLHEYLASLPES